MQIVQDDTAVGFGGHDACFACLARNSFLLCVNWHDDSDYKLTMVVWLNSLADLQALHAECRCYC